MNSWHIFCRIPSPSAVCPYDLGLVVHFGEILLRKNEVVVAVVVVVEERKKNSRDFICTFRKKIAYISHSLRRCLPVCCVSGDFFFFLEDEIDYSHVWGWNIEKKIREETAESAGGCTTPKEFGNISLPPTRTWKVLEPIAQFANWNARNMKFQFHFQPLAHIPHMDVHSHTLLRRLFTFFLCMCGIPIKAVKYDAFQYVLPLLHTSYCSFSPSAMLKLARPAVVFIVTTETKMNNNDIVHRKPRGYVRWHNSGC